MLWANFLHFYQPPTQKKEIVDRVVRECYRPVLSGLLSIPQAKLTINFSSCLAELLNRFGHQDVLQLVRKLLESDKIELTASAKYHPLLPKLPQNEIFRQIKLDMETNSRFFGESYKPVGFFPPEMAFDKNLAEIVSSMGFNWIIVDEYSYPTKTRHFWKPADSAGDSRIKNGFWTSQNDEEDKCQWNKIYRIKDLPLQIFFRERKISFKILSAQLGTTKMLVEELGKELSPDRYLLTAMDGETFGHHRPGLEEMLFDVYRSNILKAAKVSDLGQNFPLEEVEPQSATWALLKMDRVRHVPFGRWDDPDNQIQKWQWQLTDLAIKTASNLAETASARQLLDRAVHSDQYWWSSAKPWWSIEYVEAGAKELLEVVKASLATKKEILTAYGLYINILTTAFDWQRTGKVEEMSKAADEEMFNRPGEIETKVDKEEIKKMIARLDKQRKTAADHQEYERAAQLRNRIKELEWYLK